LQGRFIYFTIAVVRLDGSHEEIKTNGSLISEAQKKLISTLKPGDKLWVENITWRAVDGCTRQLACIVKTVKLR